MLRPFPVPFLTLAAIALPAWAPLAAQNVNVRQLGHVDKYPGSSAGRNNYAGMWGLVGRDGKEYAILPARSGTIIYDCSNPAAPVEVIEIPGPTTTGSIFWRESNSLGGDYVYCSSEHGVLQSINMTNPSAPALGATFGSRAHTVSVDVGARRLWANGGTGRGSLCYDLAANPTSPPQIGGYTSVYVHDMLPIRGHGYFAMINNGYVQIRNISNPAATTLVSQRTTPGSFTHNAWINDDETIMITADENQGGCMTVYDITNKAAPVQVSTWCSPNGATVHNVFIKGNVALFSCYTDGFWAVDLSNPAAPAAICHFDSSAFSGSGYDGCWGLYPFQPSGVVYMSDMQTGLWIVEPTCGVPVHYGAATNGSGGFVPRINYTGGFAKVGNANFKIAGDDMLGGTTAALLFGFGATNVPIFGVNILVDLTGAYFLVLAQTGGTAGVPGSGSMTVSVPIPNNGSVAGTTTHTQFLVVDPGAPGGVFAASPGMKLVVCP
jgi:choice-of-anchor B domain-containing protein